MKNLIFLVVLITTLFGACRSRGVLKSETQAQHSPGLTVKDETLPLTQTQVDPPALPDSVVVSFYSKGEGAPFAVIREFDAFISGHPGQKFYDRIPWGREGEIDYCIRLKNFGYPEKLSLINRIREITSRTELVHVTENGPCRMRGRGSN